MKKSIFILLLILSIPIFAEEPTNLDTLKKEVMAYHDSGEYQGDIADVTLSAANYLKERVTQNAYVKNPKKLAIVFDIDETALSNYPDMLDLNFGGNSKLYAAENSKANDAAIQQTLALYQLAEKDHVAVFFITGRRQALNNATIKNLRAEGYAKWDGLFLAPDNYHESSIVPFKSSTRRDITNKGYDIIINIGDQESDLKGGYADKTYKLPNPYYFIP